MLCLLACADVEAVEEDLEQEEEDGIKLEAFNLKARPPRVLGGAAVQQCCWEIPLAGWLAVTGWTGDRACLCDWGLVALQAQQNQQMHGRLPILDNAIMPCRRSVSGDTSMRPATMLSGRTRMRLSWRRMPGCSRMKVRCLSQAPLLHPKKLCRVAGTLPCWPSKWLAHWPQPALTVSAHYSAER